MDLTAYDICSPLETEYVPHHAAHSAAWRENTQIQQKFWLLCGVLLHAVFWESVRLFSHEVFVKP